MCVVKRKIRSVGTTHPLQAFTPCGKCFDCRKREQNSWLFRLRAEFENLDSTKWYAVFATLTYNEKSVPYIPKLLLKKGEKFKRVMCFSKKHVRDFADAMRKFLESKGAKKEYASRYIICSEFGERTQRSHYHMLYVVPSIVDAKELFCKVKELWSEKGFVFPKDFKGGVDGHGYEHKPFVVENLSKASQYVSKYISKDIAFMRNEDLKLFKKDAILKESGKWLTRFYRYRGQLYSKLVCNDGRILKKDEKVRLTDYLPFHVQSRCLGFGYVNKLKSRGDDEILRKLKDGEFFGIETFARPLPRYIVNKLLFGVRYGKKNDKRIVRYYGNVFFEKNYRQIFAIKVAKTVERISKFTKLTQSRIFSMCRNVIAYNGIEERFLEKDPALMWSRRYEVDSIFEFGKEFMTVSLPPKRKRIRNKVKEIVKNDLKEYYRLMQIVNDDELVNSSIMEKENQTAQYIVDALRSEEY